MASIHGSKRFQNLSSKLSRSLREHSEEIFPPNAQKTLRMFSAREVSDFIGINYNTFRHYQQLYAETFPAGTMINGNRRFYTADEMQEIRDHLWAENRIGINEYRRRQAGEPMQVITTFNLKGGVSKTSTTVHLGQILALRGYRVLLVDLDAQASLTNLLGITPEYHPEMPTAYDAIRFNDPIPMRDAIQKTYFPGLHLLPSSMDIVEYEYDTAVAFKTNRSGPQFHARLAQALDQVRDDYDVVVIDTPPHMGFAVIAAIFASTGLLVPLNASMLDVMSLASFMSMAADLMEIVEEQTGSPKPFNFIRFLITRYEGTDLPQIQMASYLRTILGESVISTEFVKSTAIGDAANTKQPLLEIEPKDMSKKTYDRAMESLNRIADEVEGDLRQAWGRK